MRPLLQRAFNPRARKVRRILLLLLSLLATPAAWAQATPTLDEALRALEEPITVQTRVGRDFEGYPVGTTRDALTLRVRVDEGSAELTFPREDVLRLRFPGNGLKQRALELADTGALDQALRVIDALFSQRSVFLPYVGERETRFFAETLSLYRQSGRILEGLARIEIIRPLLADPVLLRALDKEQLLGTHLLEMSAAARSQAEAWLAREGREPESALGALILATHQLNARDADAALFTLLDPIVFSGARRIEYLDLCYAFAIELATVVEQPDLASRLRAERDRRGLTAPESWDPLTPPDFSVLTNLQPPS